MNLITKHKIAKAHADDMRDEIDKQESLDSSVGPKTRAKIKKLVA